MSVFTAAVRGKFPLRVALYGVASGHMTPTALELAEELGERVAVIDTERGSAMRWARQEGGEDGYVFDQLVLDAFSPGALVEALASAVAGRYPVVVVDSVSAFWTGADGLLHQQAEAAKKARNATPSSAWHEVRPLERAMWDAIHAYPGHVVLTMRCRATHVVVEGEEGGQRRVRRVALAPEQREGVEYEGDFVGEVDEYRRVTVVSSRHPDMAAGEVVEPGAPLARRLAQWADAGVPSPDPMSYVERTLHGLDTWSQAQQLLAELREARFLKIPMLHPTSGKVCTLQELVEKRATFLYGHERQAARDAARAARAGAGGESGAAGSDSG
jgi:hypothetical protein